MFRFPLSSLASSRVSPHLPPLHHKHMNQFFSLISRKMFSIRSCYITRALSLSLASQIALALSYYVPETQIMETCISFFFSLTLPILKEPNDKCYNPIQADSSTKPASSAKSDEDPSSGLMDLMKKVSSGINTPS